MYFNVRRFSFYSRHVLSFHVPSVIRQYPKLVLELGVSRNLKVRPVSYFYDDTYPLRISSLIDHPFIANSSNIHLTMGSDGRNSGESERKLEGGVSEKQQRSSPGPAPPTGDGGLHPAIYIAYAGS
jgi:hypothetical protein